MEQKTLKPERNTGVDALRVVSMFMIVVLHVLGPGGILASLPALSGRYFAAWFLEIACYCAANCYALISGYVGRNASFRYSRLAQLWLQMIFYTLLITLGFWLFVPGSVQKINWICAILPVTTKQYWYLTAYFGLFFLMPVFNIALNHLEKGSLAALVAAIFLVFSLIPCLLQMDPFELRDGYSTLWLCLLYLIGGALARCNAVSYIRKPAALIGFFACVIITWISKLLLVYRSMRLYGEAFGGDALIRYTSPTILAAAIFLLLLFAQLKITVGVHVRLIGQLAPASLAVYIIHVNPLIFIRWMEWRFASFASDPIALLLLKVLAVAAAIYLLCCAVEVLRSKLFRLLGIGKCLQAFEQRCRSALTRRFGKV